jgi:hypothetical protein
MNGTTVHRNFLDRPTQRKIEDLLIERRGEIEAGRWTKDTIARLCEQQFGRPVTPANIEGCAQAVEIQFPRQKSNQSLRTLNECKAAIKLLAGEVCKLRGELGTPASPTLRAIAGLDDSK